MAILESLEFRSRSTTCSALALPMTSDGPELNHNGMASSPFDLALANTTRSCDVVPRHVSSLTLRPTPCDPKVATYRNGQITPTSPQLPAVKADKTPFPPPLPNAWAWSLEDTSGLASLPPTRSDEGPSSWYGSTLQSPKELLQLQRRYSQQYKPLLSPIEFDYDVETRPTNEKGEPPLSDLFNDDELHPAYDDTLSFHSSDWDLVAPSRRLSYGEPVDMIGPSSTRKSTGSTELPSRVKVLAEDKRCDAWIDDTLKAYAYRPYDSEPPRRKPRLWLDLVADDEEIAEAYATAVTTSPSKPRMISIGPRRTDVETAHDEPRSPAISNFQPGVSTFLPETPPRSPTPSAETPRCLSPSVRVRSMEVADTSRHVRQLHAFNRIRSRTTLSTKSPTSADTILGSSETVRQDCRQPLSVSTSPAPLRRATPPPMPVKTDIKLSELTTWIITELEIAVTSTASQVLQLEHPVIQQLRLPPKQRKAPRTTPLIPAQSSFSATQGPLSSHTSPSDFAPAPRKTCTWPSAVHEPTTTLAPDATFAILSRVFPLAPRPILSHLLAAILAHQFISSLHLPLTQQTPTSSTSPYAAQQVCQPFPPQTTTAAHLNGLPEHIPSKARAMLGLPPPQSPGKPKDGRPPLPIFWRKMEKLEWKERVAELEESLRRVVRGSVRELVGGDERKSGERWLDALVSAVGEAVKLGEGTRVAAALK